MFPALRIAVAAVSALLLLAGLFLVVGGGPPLVSGLWLLVLGGTGLIVVTLERTRYRSEAAELSGEAPGAAGIDTGPPEPRFRPTEERFVDPTTRQRLRVWVDPSTGERRYRADDATA
ncbi:MAG TPA: hypothetical protein VFM19_05365 [Candidatus Limnocylindria bacterium]|nr:hypothetical protein [Candidatus Limnocylindria bacterium]